MNDILTVSGLNKSYGDFSLKDDILFARGVYHRFYWCQWSR